MSLLILDLIQTPNNPHRIFRRRIQQIGITRLARDQHFDVGQAELFPFVLVFDRGISGFKDLVFAGRHDLDGFDMVSMLYAFLRLIRLLSKSNWRRMSVDLRWNGMSEHAFGALP